MKTIVIFVVFIAVTSAQYQSAFESFMSRNRDYFPNISIQQAAPSQQARSASYARSSVTYDQPEASFVTSNSHIQTLNPPQSASGHNLQGFVHNPQSGQIFGSAASSFFGSLPQQQQPQQPQQQQPSFSAFNSAPMSNHAHYFNPAQFNNQALSRSTSVRTSGFENFVFMMPSNQPVQGAALKKVIRSPNGVDREVYYVPMPNYAPPTVYNYQTVHGNSNNQQQ